jgi:hypothetical protein
MHLFTLSQCMPECGDLSQLHARMGETGSMHTRMGEGFCLILLDLWATWFIYFLFINYYYYFFFWLGLGGNDHLKMV